MTINTNTVALLEKIESAQKIVLLTHINPDADTLCSAFAVYDMLFRRQKKAVLFNASSELAVNLAKLPYSDKIRNTLPDHFDLAISFDCGSFDRLGIEAFDAYLVNIDHHFSNEAYGDLNIIDVEKVSTTQVVYDLFKMTGWKISALAAQCIYTGIVSDSLSFGTNRVNSELFMTASELLRLGASAETARDILYEQHSLARMRLAASMMDTLHLHHEGKLAIVHASQEMFERTGAKRNDSEEVLRMVMSMGVVETALVLRYEIDGRLKGSLRSKGAVDVEKIASELGGGGHKRASGFETDMNIEAISNYIIDMTLKELA